MTERLTIVNRARSAIGHGRLNSELDPAALTSLEVYDTVVEDILSKRDWSFSTPVAQLAKLVEAPGPDTAWAFQYALPSDRIGPLRAVYDSKDWCSPFKLYELRHIGDPGSASGAGAPRLLTDAELIFVRYPRLTTMQAWPGYFRRLIVDACKAHYALSIREDQVLHLQLMKLVYGSADEGGIGGMLGDAMALDSAGRPSPTLEMDEGPLISARWEW